MTKGARRRNAYVTVVIMGFFTVFGTIDHWSWFWVLFSTFFLVDALHTLATVGFTSRANNEK